MSDRYTTPAADALNIAKEEANRLSNGFISSEHILLGLIMGGSGVAARVLQENNVTERRIKDLIDQHIVHGYNPSLTKQDGFSPMASKILENAMNEAVRFKSQLVGTEHILMSIIKVTDSLAYKLLYTMRVNIQKIYLELMASLGEDVMPRRKNAEDDEEEMPSGIVEGTPTLEEYSRDLTKLAREGMLDPVIGREAQMNRVMQILSRRGKNNPCLIGEPGVGKTAVVEGLAQKIANGDVPEILAGKRVMTLDLAAMVAGSKYRGEFEERIKNVLEEIIHAKDVILFIDELHTIIGAGDSQGSLDASNIMKPSLARGELQLIGATTLAEYRKYIEKDAALERRFQPVNVEEPSEEEAVLILKGLRPRYEEHHQLKITDSALEAAVKLSTRYISDRFLPDKAVDLIDEAASRARLNEYIEPAQIKEWDEDIVKLEKQKEQAILDENFEKAGVIKKKQEKLRDKQSKLREEWKAAKENKKLIVDEKEIAEVVGMWTKIPVSKLTQGESERLKNLEHILHERVVGQHDAVVAIAKAIRRGRVGLKDPKRPIGSLLFLGPTGVGKTELSKALAEAMFGSENALIRVDMSEYMEKHSVSKIVGSPPGYVGYDEGGQLSEKVRRNPYSVILLDEIEKAHPDVFNILLQVLDDGHITDSQGRKIDFKNTVIIMTSNAGAQRIIEPKLLGFHAVADEDRDYHAMKDNVLEEVRQMFRPEFLNRIDETIVFHQLTKSDMTSIIEILLKEINKRLSDQMHISLHLSEAAKEFLVEKGYDKKYGARPLKRTMQNMLEDRLAEEILEGKIKPNSEVLVDLEGERLTFQSTKNKKKKKDSKNEITTN